MKIKIKTHLIELIIEDEPLVVGGYTKHVVPELSKALEAAVNEAIKLHNEVILNK